MQRAFSETPKRLKDVCCPVLLYYIFLISISFPIILPSLFTSNLTTFLLNLNPNLPLNLLLLLPYYPPFSTIHPQNDLILNLF